MSLRSCDLRDSLRQQGVVVEHQRSDHLSVRVLTDSSGTKIGEQAHYPYGEDWYLHDTTTSYMFTSYPHEAESGNDYAIHRSHSCRLGRFTTADPVRGRIRNPQRLNRYAYVMGDPIGRRDPRGLDTRSEDPEGDYFLELIDNAGAGGGSSEGPGGASAAVWRGKYGFDAIWNATYNSVWGIPNWGLPSIIPLHGPPPGGPLPPLFPGGGGLFDWHDLLNGWGPTDCKVTTRGRSDAQLCRTEDLLLRVWECEGDRYCCLAKKREFLDWCYDLPKNKATNLEYTYVRETNWLQGYAHCCGVKKK